MLFHMEPKDTSERLKRVVRLGDIVGGIAARLRAAHNGIESPSAEAPGKVALAPAKPVGGESQQPLRGGGWARDANAGKTQECFLFGGGAHSAVANPLIAPRETRFMVAA